MTRAFNTGKVKIGEVYVPRQRQEMSKDAFDLQTQLLRQKPPTVDWDGVLIAAVMTALVTGGLAKLWGLL